MIATDKTGTLTCNELTVREVCLTNGQPFRVTGEGFAPGGVVLYGDEPVRPEIHPELDRLVRVAVLCNEGDLGDRNGGWVWRGDAVDIALLSLGRKLGHDRKVLSDQYPQVSQIPYESENQFAATLHRDTNETLVLVKGAHERILEMCAGRENADDLERWETTALDMARRGLRVLAIAEGSLPCAVDSDGAPPEPTDLRFLGFVGMIDPLRPGVREAVRTCREAGYRSLWSPAIIALPPWPSPATLVGRARGRSGHRSRTDTRDGGRLGQHARARVRVCAGRSPSEVADRGSGSAGWPFCGCHRRRRGTRRLPCARQTSASPWEERHGAARKGCTTGFAVEFWDLCRRGWILSWSPGV